MQPKTGLFFTLTALTLIFLSTFRPAGAVNDVMTSSGLATVIPGRLEVQFESDVSGDAMSTSLNRLSFGILTLDRSLEKIQVKDAIQMFPWRNGTKALVGNNDMSKYYEIFFPEEIDLNEAINELLQNPYVRSVDPVYAIPVAVTPNDPSFNLQWAVKKVNDTAAYNIEKGSDTAKIAIIDSGVLYDHPDLLDNIWVNPGEDLDGDMVVFDADDSNLVDNDGNYYDDLIGWDFFSGFGGDVTCEDWDCGTPDNNPIDWDGHGTHCAGIAAMVTNNGTGGAGIAGGWGGGKGPHRGPRIICIRVGGSGYRPDAGHTGFVNSTNCAEGIDYAVSVGADVVNMSWGVSNTGAMQSALLNCQANNVLAIHAAGNAGSTMGDFCDAWAMVTSVAWTNADDRKNTYSNYGSWIDISAPGTSIYSTYPSNFSPTYAWLDGTSMAAPHVAGAVALLRSHNPALTLTQVQDLIYDNADDMYGEPLWIQGYMGSGRLNTYNMFDSMATAAFEAGPVLIGEAPLTVDFTDLSPYSPTTWSWDFGDGGGSSDQNPEHTYNDYGLKTVMLTVDDQFGNATEVLKNLIMITADTMKFQSISAEPGEHIVVPVYLDNKYLSKSITVPFKIRDNGGGVPDYITFDSANTTGLRTDYFESVSSIFFDPFNLRYTYTMLPNIAGGSTYLTADTGAILNLFLTVSGSITASKQVIIEDTTLSGRVAKLESVIYDYYPVVMPGIISITVCQRGDVNGDEDINIFDITYLINYLYKGGPTPPDLTCADVNDDGDINIFDITYLINYLYKGGPPPPA